MLTVTTFFQCFIYDPLSPFLEPKERRISKQASDILSFFLLPVLCKWFWGKYKIDVILSRAKEITQVEHDEPCHQIVNKLFIGRSDAFVDSSYLRFDHVNKYYRPCIKTTLNLRDFESLITMCPLSAIYLEYPGLQELKPDAIAHSFRDHQVKWLYVGRTILDRPENWLPLVHDCTLIHSVDAQVDLKPHWVLNDLKELQMRKTAAILKENVVNWFKPVFAEMDEAVFMDRKILVHCQAGVSRSPSLVAAYLINRFGMTADQALEFLKIKRPCVNPSFMHPLRHYEENLKLAIKSCDF